MTIVLCTESADPSPILARSAGAPSLYLSWGEARDAQFGLGALPHNWEMCDVSQVQPAPATVAAAELIVSGLPPAAWSEPAAADLGELLRSAAHASATLLLLGPSIGFAGEWLADGTSGHGLIPGTVILHDLQSVPDLRGLLAALSAGETRLLALDGPVIVEYDPAADQVTVSGGGSALLATFGPEAGGQPSVRLHVLAAGSSSGWPA